MGANYIKVNNIECKIIVNTTHLLVVERFYFYTTNGKIYLEKKAGGKYRSCRGVRLAYGRTEAPDALLRRGGGTFLL